ncbi:hypothetical protein [Methylobacterium sp. ID0610]|uniref:hypothetical protein n=1 Tax=Methylobacterium carpenticola TaxID=3344827 RepID=UPI0036B6FEE8
MRQDDLGLILAGHAIAAALVVFVVLAARPETRAVPVQPNGPSVIVLGTRP